MGTALISIRFSLRCPGLLFTNSPCQLTSHSLIPVLNPSDRLLQNRLMSGFICLRPHPPLLPSHFDYDPPASNSMKLLFLSQFVNRIFSSNYYYDFFFSVAVRIAVAGDHNWSMHSNLQVFNVPTSWTLIFILIY